MGINMGNFFRGVLYTGLATVTGIAGYMVGKYKHMNSKVSLTMVGLALVLYAPKGCDVAETYLKTHAEIEKVRVYGETRKDSIDAIVRTNELKDSTLYLKQFLQNATELRENLEKKYSSMISTNQLEYQKLLKKNDIQYKSTLENLVKQNDLLTKNIENLKKTQDSVYSIVEPKKVVSTNASATSSTETKPKDPVSDVLKYRGKPHTLISSEVLADGSTVNKLRYEDGHIIVLQFPPPDNYQANKTKKSIFNR